MRTARTRSVARDGSPRLASLIAREIELLATRHGRIVAFDVEEIDAVAEHLAELAASTRAPTVGLIDARELAEQLGVARDWVYANADRLGGVRLGMARGHGCASTPSRHERHWRRAGGRPPLSNGAPPRPRRGRPRRERRYRRAPDSRQVQPVIADGPFRSHAGIALAGFSVVMDTQTADGGSAEAHRPRRGRG